MDFEIVGEITVLETIAAGAGIRDLKRLRRIYGKGRWKSNGNATWTKAMKRRKFTGAHFAVCINNKGYPASGTAQDLSRIAG